MAEYPGPRKPLPAQSISIHYEGKASEAVRGCPTLLTEGLRHS